MKLYVVATPIGNMEDMSPRAVSTLKSVDVIAVEDTRHSRGLMQHFGISTPLVACHDHNEAAVAENLVARMLSGDSVALISDAGTPLISDPGYRLVSEAKKAGIEVLAIPGPSALIAALSISGLPTDQFSFVGFLPAKELAREKRLAELANSASTLVFYEAPHRIESSLNAMRLAFGGDRACSVSREITKKFEQTFSGSLDQTCQALESGELKIKGEFVVVVAGSEVQQAGNEEAMQIMTILLRELPPKKAASIAQELTGIPKKALYDMALSLKEK